MFTKIKTLGCNNYTSQLYRVNQGFRALGHKVVEDDYDILYCNNVLQDDELDTNKKNILNILDIPEHLLPNCLPEIKEYAKKADKLTCISKFVQSQIRKHLKLEASVIYNPAKEVFRDEAIPKEFDFLYVGRAGDKNKRFLLAHDVAFNLNKKIVVCGSEQINSHAVQNVGVVNDYVLGQLYNKAKFVLLPSKLEGIGLPMIEAMICGTIPILCSDNQTAYEFAPEWCICDPDSFSITDKVNEIQRDYESYRRDIIENYSDRLSLQFSKEMVARNILAA